jgi:cyanophycinase
MNRPRRNPLIVLATLLPLLLLVVGAPALAGPARGDLLIIGGGDRPSSVMGLFACLARGAEGKVLVFPQASERPEAGSEIEQELKALGLGQVVVVATDRAGADTEDFLRLADGATGVYFGGGDQARLMAVLLGSRLARRLHDLHDAGAVIAGTSAGAAVMSRVMITGDEKRPLSKDENWQTIEADNVITADGLGFLDDVIVDQHFVRRRRHSRLISLVLEKPDLLGMAIDESTAVWVKPGRSFEVVGDGPVLVLDAKGATIARDDTGYGLRGTGLRLDVLRPGATYDLAARKVTRLGTMPRSAAPPPCPGR